MFSTQSDPAHTNTVTLFITTKSLQHIYDYSVDKLFCYKKGNCCQSGALLTMLCSRRSLLNSAVQCSAPCTVHSARCTVYGARCCAVLNSAVHGARCTVHCARCTVHGALCCAVQCSVLHYGVVHYNTVHFIVV